MLLSQARLVLAPSRRVREYIQRKHVGHTTEVVVFRAGVDSRLTPPQATDCSQREDVFRISYIGSVLGAEPTLLVEAVERVRREFPNVLLHIFTNGSFLRDELAQLLSRDWIRISATARYASFAQYVAETDILVLPYPRDSYLQMAWPLKFPMYLAAGRPLVMTEVGEMGEFARSTESCILTEPNPEALSRGIIKVLMDYKGYLFRAATMQARVVRELSWTNTMADAVASIRRLIKYELQQQPSSDHR